ncbi:MAG: dihydrodipicolinate synthase family protein [Pleurocapsa sp. MO_226.B13]|nr:dihydrodipicolinate synthase family protein [Pleurocapsa sp. MO_226.B13]
MLRDRKKTSQQRQNLVRELVGGEMPRLWCPPLTHYTSEGSLDKERIAAHWASMVPNVNAFLVPGSTGDGWEMSDDEIKELLDFTIELAGKLDALLLIGVLKSDVSSMCEAIAKILTMLEQKAGVEDPIEVLKRTKVCGFTVCPAHGNQLTQEQIQVDLETVLALNLPTAIYQLPQITANEMSSTLIARLAECYPNFFLFKDSSGSDRVALADSNQSGIFLVRGAEGQYSEWLQESGGPYHGLLLSTANCFSAQLRAIVTLLEDGRIKEAKNLSDRLTQVVDLVFKLVSNLPQGNPFTNANKAIDHFLAYGSEADRFPPPMLYSGIRLPEKVIREVGEILKKAQLISKTGYL